MQEKIIGLYPSHGKMKIIDIFGYSTKGIPGIEIIGLGNLNKILKEKLIYILKSKDIKFPLRRFVLSTSHPLMIQKSNQPDLEWLELAYFLLLSKLLKLIPIRKLDNCLCCGKLNINGKIDIFNFTTKFKKEILKRDFILIDQSNNINMNLYNKSICLEDLLK